MHHSGNVTRIRKYSLIVSGSTWSTICRVMTWRSTGEELCLTSSFGREAVFFLLKILARNWRCFLDCYPIIMKLSYESYYSMHDYHSTSSPAPQSVEAKLSFVPLRYRLGLGKSSDWYTSIGKERGSKGLKLSFYQIFGIASFKDICAFCAFGYYSNGSSKEGSRVERFCFGSDMSDYFTSLIGCIGLIGGGKIEALLLWGLSGTDIFSSFLNWSSGFSFFSGSSSIFKEDLIFFSSGALLINGLGTLGRSLHSEGGFYSSFFDFFTSFEGWFFKLDGASIFEAGLFLFCWDSLLSSWWRTIGSSLHSGSYFSFAWDFSFISSFFYSGNKLFGV